MILCLISLRYVIKILVGVQLQQRISSQVLELASVDSRACASRPHQVLKRSLAHWIMVWTKSRKRRRFSSEDFLREDLCLGLFVIRFCFQIKCKGQISWWIVQVHLHSHTRFIYVFIIEFSFQKIPVWFLKIKNILVFYQNLILELNVKNVDISSYTCSGSYPYTLSFKSVQNILFCIWRSFKKINLEKYRFCFKPKFLSHKNSSKCL